MSLTAKQYLSQLFKIRALIAAKEEYIAELRRRAAVRANRMGFEPSTGSPSDRLGEYVAKIVDAQTLVARQKMALLEVEKEVIARIDALDNQTYRLLLTLRYVNCKKWEEIALAMGYSWRNTVRLHGEALRYFESCHILSYWGVV
jgi:hypothetical protein